MSKHWQPDDELALTRATRAEARPRLSAGSVAGLTIVAAACVGMAVLLYRLAGPRDIFGS